MNKEIAIKNLKQFTNCLDEKYFLIYGTCLGALREEDIITHDLDIDIGIMEGDFKFEMVNLIMSKGFSLERIFGMPTCGFEMSFRKNGVKVDLMLFYTNNDLIWNSLWDNACKNGLSDMIVHSYSADVFELEQLKIGKNYFYSLGEKYIKEVYGENWRTPITPWNWRTDHFCIDDNLKIELIKKYGY